MPDSSKAPSLKPRLWFAQVDASNTTIVTTTLLGKARIPGLAYENADGSPVKIERDYFGEKRNESSPSPGPFEVFGAEPLILKV